MKHLNKIFSVLLTAAIAVSMLIAAVPVGAADNAWTEFKVPAMSAYTGSGLLTKGIDGALYAYTNTATANTNSLTKSTDGGRTWTSVKTPGAVAGAAAITAIATSPSEANVLYIATGMSVWKSIDSGATFAALPVGTVPAPATSLAVGLLGGSYKVFAGSAAGVYLFDEGVGLNNQFVVFGGSGGLNVLDVKLSPTFNTAAGIYALTSTGTDAQVWVSTGSAFAATPATVASGAGTTVGEIGFSADFNVTSNPVLWVGVNGANGGIFRTTLGGTGFKLGATLPVATIDVTGSGVFGGAVTIVFGTTAGAVYITSNAGVSFSNAAKNLPGTGTAFVALANDYATSGTVFVLKAAAAAGDESGFSVSTDKAANFSQISLLNSSIFAITDTAFAANGDIYMVTSAATAAPSIGDAFTVTSTALAGTTGDTITLTANAAGGWFQADNAIFDTATANPVTVVITAAAAGDVTVAVTGGVGLINADPVFTISAAAAGERVTVTKTTATPSTSVTIVQTVGAPADLVLPPVGVDQNFQPGPFLTGVAFPMDLNPLDVVLYVPGDTAVMAPAGPFIFTAVGQTQLLTTTTAGNFSFTTQSFGATVGTANVTAAVTSNADGAPIVIVNAINPVATGSVAGVNLNNQATVAVNGAVSILAGAGAGVTGVAPAQTITFTGIGQTATVTATAAGSVTWTNTLGTATAGAPIVDPNASMVIGASGAPFNMDMNNATVAGNASLWRNAGGKWDRIQGDQAVGKYAKIAVSPNYATDKGVYYVAGNIIQASTNNGVSFTAQSFSPGTINTYVALDNATFVVATGTGIMRTTNNGFVWNSVSAVNAAYLVRSSDATAMAAVTAAGDVFLSVDLGATWKAALSTGLALAGVSAVTFQNGSNTVLWATTATGGISKLDTAATTVAWVAQPTAAALDNGVGIASGVATSPVIYALDNNGSLTRLIGDASAAQNIAAATGVTAATNLFIVPAAGGNTLWAVTATKLYTFKDTIAVAVPNVAVASFTTETANVTFGAVSGATDYAVFVKAGSTAQKDYFTATTAGTVTVDKTALTASVSGLVSNTTYTISVFAKTPYISLVGSKTFSTQPKVVEPPVNMAPRAGATGIAVTPGFAWGAVPGATSYTVEVSTVPTFATLVGTKQTTTIPAFAWTTPALANNTTYYWRVVAVTATGTSDPVISVFTTVAAQVTTPPVTIPTQPVVTPTITVEIPEKATPAYIWAIIGIGALLVILIVVLTVRTRRVV